jgi:formyltetrahydrofolate deformylase
MRYQHLNNLARLVIHCPDQPGIIAEVTNFLKSKGANIIDLDQHASTLNGGEFFMRLEFQPNTKEFDVESVNSLFAEKVGFKFSMQWKLTQAVNLKKMVLMVSKHDHAFLEILWRVKRKELAIEIPCVISNHNELQSICEGFGVPFHYVQTSESKKQTEKNILKLIDEDVDGIILARYMQILSPEFVNKFQGRIINIHHSFLPAFAGANPYQQAYDQGVKLIGATAHFVTEQLDEGPIIAQDVVRVSHRHDSNQLKELGRDVERSVLTRAVKCFSEDRIILNKNKTVVFE